MIFKMLNIIFTVILLLGSVLTQEPTVEIHLSTSKANVGETLTITCKVKDVAGGETIFMGRFVKLDYAEVDTMPQNQQMSINTQLTTKYKDNARFTFSEPTEEGEYTNYKIVINGVTEEDSAHYYCSFMDTEISDEKLFEVYSMPTMVSFTNYSNVDLMADQLVVQEGETVNLECEATNVVPLPVMKVMVDEWDYTPMFKHRDHSVKLGCLPNAPGCLLHFTNDLSIRAINFRPDYSADGKQLICKAELPDSDLEPKQAALTVVMTYKPKFRCLPKQKIALGETNAEMVCKIISNPELMAETIYAKFDLDGVSVVLHSGENTADGEISMSQQRIDNRETELKLTFKEIRDEHYSMTFNVMAENRLGSNSTVLQWVTPDYVRPNDAISIFSNIFLMAATIMFYILY